MTVAVTVAHVCYKHDGHALINRKKELKKLYSMPQVNVYI